MTSSSSTLLKEQVLAWLHGDNESVVTCQTIQQDGRCYEDTAGEDDDDDDTGHAVSRYEGSQLLAEIYRNGRKMSANNNSDNTYIATLCIKRDYTTPVTPDSTGGVAHDYKTTGTYSYFCFVLSLFSSPLYNALFNKKKRQSLHHTLFSFFCIVSLIYVNKFLPVRPGMNYY